jgi:hypothetical protein
LSNYPSVKRGRATPKPKKRPASEQTTLASLLTVQLRDDEGVASLYGHLARSNFGEAATLVAKGIAARRIVNKRLHTVWLEQVAGKQTGPSSRDVSLLQAGLLQNIGTPEHRAPLSHLHGLITEEIWFQIVGGANVGPGVPIRVEGHDYSATDPGGDGLTIYGASDGGFAFRLWESKYHGSAGQIGETVGVACRQIDNRALSYLTRFSLIAQMITDDVALATFYSRLPELWADDDPSSGVGVALGATDSSSPNGCFSGMLGYFGFTPNRYQGHLSTVEDFNDFADLVRKIVWRGCGWIVH